ncbi:hypothetical protein DYQ86_08205 [Acidobacteria bacterium AB60]|nr:hypothetical protein DYQ86_08205 [Acidobacteria bacterium AB60]
MNLVVANVSTRIPHGSFRAAIRAIQKQVTNHFKAEWNLGAEIMPIALPLGARKAPVQKNADAVIYLCNSSNDPAVGVKDAYGYHAANNKGIPYGFVYLDVCAQSDESWTCTLSHEVLELLGDPDAVLTVTGPSPKNPQKTVYYDLEVCDPTQGDTYTIDDVEVSNFVGRRYFGMSGGSGRTNHLNRRLPQFGVRPGGYLQYELSGKAHVIYGPEVTDAQKAAKKKMKHVRRNARRQNRLAR